MEDILRLLLSPAVLAAVLVAVIGLILTTNRRSKASAQDRIAGARDKIHARREVSRDDSRTERRQARRRVEGELRDLKKDLR
jgi:hypothetical protein